MAADEKPADKPVEKPAAKAAEKPAAAAKAPKRKSARKPKPKAAAPAKAAAEPKVAAPKKSGKYLVLHNVTHNGEPFLPGDHMDFDPWPSGTYTAAGKPVMVDAETMKAHIDGLLASGVIVLAGAKGAKEALDKADADREAAARKAG